jgi:uncharacterized protein (DUF1330 family)
MRTNYKLVLAVLVGVSIGVTVAKAMNEGQVAPQPAFLVSEVESIDLTSIQKYGEKVPETLAPFNGHYHFILGAGAKFEPLDGEPPKGMVVIAFDNSEKAREWYDSPAYQAIKPIRLGASKGRMFIVQGVSP